MADAAPVDSQHSLSSDDRRARHLAAVERAGVEAMAFAGLKPGMRHWQDDAPGGTGASVAYADTGRTWVAVGAPVGAAPEVPRAMAAFVAAAAEAGRSACFFGTEALAPPGLAALRIGEQPLFEPARWAETVAAHRRLKEQLRRARAKGVRVRRVAPGELTAGATLRATLEDLAAAWLAAHHIEPMGFVVEPRPFELPDRHRYFIAERAGVVIGFLSAVPIPARRGWLVEDLFRARDAPNGTSELLLDACMRDVVDADVVTLGLAPLAGPVRWWLRLARWGMRPLYDFEGLRAFKARLRPRAWQPVWLVHARRRGALAILAALRAFARGRLIGFGLRSLVRHPSGPPFALAAPLVPWTLALALVALTGRADLFAYSQPALWLWVAFDAALAVVLYRAARRPTPKRLGLGLGLATLDAALSLRHLAATGLGPGPPAALLRALATLAPVLGSLALWSAWRRARRAR